jgi:hypothetical protein
MTGKISAAVVVGILLGSVGIASAQIGRTGPIYGYYNKPYYNYYYNGAYWRGIQGGAAYRGWRYDPSKGRYWDNSYWDEVAPY